MVHVKETKMRPIHPGEILLTEFIIPKSRSLHTLASYLRLGDEELTSLLMCKSHARITNYTAQALAGFYDTTPEFWLNLQETYDDKCEKAANLQS